MAAKRKLKAHMKNRHGEKFVMAHIVEHVASGAKDPRDWRLRPRHRTPRFDPEWMDSGVKYRGVAIERVKEFRYLGSIMHECGDLSPEIEQRCQAANKAFHAIPQELWRDPLVPLTTKHRLLRSLVLSRLFYGAEAWVPTAAELAPLESHYFTYMRIIGGYREESKRIKAGGGEYVEASREAVLIGMTIPTPGEIITAARLRLWGQVVRAGPKSLLGRMAEMTPASEARRRGVHPVTWSNAVRGDLDRMPGYREEECYVPNHWKNRCKTLRQGPMEIPWFGT